MKSIKTGVGLWEQLQPEYQEKINKMWKERMKMSDKEKVEEWAHNVLRGMHLITEAVIEVEKNKITKLIPIKN